MSLRLTLLRAVMRGLVKPAMARSIGPEAARRDFARMSALFRPPPGLVHLRPERLSHRITAGTVTEERVILWFHGGAYMMGSPATHAAMLGRLSRLTRLAIVAPDYRLAPEHPAPAAFEDACAAHAALIAQGWAPGQIVLGGDSAGGGLALALLAHLCATSRHPAAVVVFSPWTDLGLTGHSLSTNASADPLLPVARICEAVEIVKGDLAPEDPRLSPLHATFDAPPPVLIQVGSDEILLDDARRMAVHLRTAGGVVDLEVWPRVPHVWQILDGLLPEARAALRVAARFVVQAETPVTSR